MIDINKPLELETGEAVEFFKITNDEIIVIVPEKYRQPLTGVHPRTLQRYFSFDGRPAFPDSTPIPNLRNVKEPTMALDLNKPLILDGKDAKIIHTFNNGNMAIVVDGRLNVYTFNKDGQYLTGDPYGISNAVLKNKVVETFQYVNVQPYYGSCYTYSSLDNAKNTSAYSVLKEKGGFRVKQTLIDGKVVKNEIIND